MSGILERVDTPLEPGTLLRRVGYQVWLITEHTERVEQDPLSFNLNNLNLLELTAQLVAAYATRYPLRLDDVLAKLRFAIAEAPFDPRSRTGSDHDLDVYKGRPPSAEGHTGVDAGGHFTWIPLPPPDDAVRWPGDQ